VDLTTVAGSGLNWMAGWLTLVEGGNVYLGATGGVGLATVLVAVHAGGALGACAPSGGAVAQPARPSARQARRRLTGLNTPTLCGS